MLCTGIVNIYSVNSCHLNVYSYVAIPFMNSKLAGLTEFAVFAKFAALAEFAASAELNPLDSLDSLDSLQSLD
jgi:hypothetical protein